MGYALNRKRAAAFLGGAAMAMINAVNINSSPSKRESRSYWPAIIHCETYR